MLRFIFKILIYTIDFIMYGSITMAMTLAFKLVPTIAKYYISIDNHLKYNKLSNGLYIVIIGFTIILIYTVSSFRDKHIK